MRLLDFSCVMNCNEVEGEIFIIFLTKRRCSVLQIFGGKAGIFYVLHTLNCLFTTLVGN